MGAKPVEIAFHAPLMPTEHYQPKTLPQVVADAAAAYGDRPAITDGALTLSYAELDAARQRSARAFIAAGLGKGDAVSLFMENRVEFLACLVAAAKLGAELRG